MKTIIFFLASMFILVACGDMSTSGKRVPKSQANDSSASMMTSRDSMIAEFDTLHAMYDIFIDELTTDEKDEFLRELQGGTVIFYEGLSQVSFDGWMNRRVFVTNEPDYYCVESPAGKPFSCKLYKARGLGDHVLTNSLTIENPLELRAALDPVRLAIGRAYLSLHKYREQRDNDRRSRMLEMTSAVK